MTTRKLVALALALLAPLGSGHFHYGRRARGIAWLAVPPLTLLAFGALLPRIGRAVGWSAACALPLAIVLVAWIASVVDLMLVREGPATRGWQTALFVAAGLVAPMIGAGVVRVLLLESFRVPSASMEPTILANDRLFVDKSDHRARYGDVVAFASPDDGQTFVKRVMARPGDVLETRRGRPWINGWEVPSCSLGEATLDDKTGELVVEFLGDASYLVFYSTTPPMAHAGPFYARANGVLVLGDARNDSFDSREFRGGLDGNVALSDVQGRAVLVWLRFTPTDDARFGIDLGADVKPRLPTSLANLARALDACLAKRPAAIPPPPLAR